MGTEEASVILLPVCTQHLPDSRWCQSCFNFSTSWIKARPGSARPGPARPGSARLGPAERHSPPPPPAGLTVREDLRSAHFQSNQRSRQQLC